MQVLAAQGFFCCERFRCCMRWCGLLPGSGTQASAVFSALECFTSLRIGVLFKEVAELQVVVHCLLNPAVAVGLVAHHL